MAINFSNNIVYNGFQIDSYMKGWINLLTDKLIGIQFHKLILVYRAGLYKLLIDTGLLRYTEINEVIWAPIQLYMYMYIF